MPDWIVWAFFGCAMIAVFGRRRRHCGGRAFRRHSWAPARLASPGYGRGSHGDARFERPVTGVRERFDVPLEGVRAGPPRPTREEREARLRSRYVSGAITVEEYEMELDEVYRRR